MKSFLYAAMAASLLLTVGCGQKKEIKPVVMVKSQVPDVSNVDDMSDDELLALLEAESSAIDADEENEGSELDTEEDDEEDEDDEAMGLDDLTAEDAQAMEEIFKNMSPEQIKQVEQDAMAELARLIAMEQKGTQKVAEMDEDQFAHALDVEKMTPEEQAQLVAWQTQASEWATEQLKLAQQESDELGLKEVLFDANSTDLQDGQEEVLKKNIEVARAAIAEGRDMVISGHAEADAEDPLSLSQLRAEVLKNALVAAGLDADHLHSTGYGSALTEYSNNAAAASFIIC